MCTCLVLKSAQILQRLHIHIHCKARQLSSSKPYFPSGPLNKFLTKLPYSKQTIQYCTNNPFVALDTAIYKRTGSQKKGFCRFCYCIGRQPGLTGKLCDVLQTFRHTTEKNLARNSFFFSLSVITMQLTMKHEVLEGIFILVLKRAGFIIVFIKDDSVSLSLS